MKAPVAPTKDGPRTNREIRAREVQLIDQEGRNQGVVQTADALQQAEDDGLDLVEIVPTAEPPVCKILDFGASPGQQAPAQQQHQVDRARRMAGRAQHVAQHDQPVARPPAPR